MTGYRVAHDVAWVEAVAPAEPERLTVVVARVPDGPPLALYDASAAIWLAATEGGDEEQVLARVLEASGQDRATVGGSVAAFLTELAGLGLLVLEQPE